VVGVVPKDVAAVDTTDDHVLKQVGTIKAGGSWHDANLATEMRLVN
jgi:hypothetical protein